MVEVNEKLTRHVAHLAKIALSESEIKLFTAQLNRVLGYVEKLQEANVEGIEPMTHPFEFNHPLREDEVIPSLKDSDGKPLILNSAPDLYNDGFKVPSIL